MTLARVLRRRGEVVQMASWLRARGLCATPDWIKSWDSALALQRVLGDPLRAPSVFDAGCRSGMLLPWLWQSGVGDLHGCDLRLPLPPLRAAWRRRELGTLLLLLRFLAAAWRRLNRASVTDTGAPAERFDYVTSMSVIEHGVPLAAFFREAHRILRSGGTLIVSTDYWPEPVDTGGSRLFNDAVDVVFDRASVAGLLEAARAAGFLAPDCGDLGAEEPVVKVRGLAYTIHYFEFRKP